MDDKFKRNSREKSLHAENKRAQLKFPAHKKSKKSDSEERPSSDLIIGRSAVSEILRSGRDINKLLIAEGEIHGSIREIIAVANERGILTAFVPRERLDSIAEGARHQGVAAYISPVPYKSVSEILSEAQNREKEPFLLVLDGIEDPQNLGAIIRTADAAGVDGVLIPSRRAAPLSATVAKASAGAVLYVPVARIGNVAQTLERLKDEGLWIIGADIEGEKSCFESDLTGSIALVIGGEGKGLSRLTRERCDFLVKIPMQGHIGSLNASVSGAILMYESLRQRIMTKQ